MTAGWAKAHAPVAHSNAVVRRLELVLMVVMMFTRRNRNAVRTSCRKSNYFIPAAIDVFVARTSVLPTVSLQMQTLYQQSGSQTLVRERSTRRRCREERPPSLCPTPALSPRRGYSERLFRRVPDSCSLVPFVV